MHSRESAYFAPSRICFMVLYRNKKKKGTIAADLNIALVCARVIPKAWVKLTDGNIWLYISSIVAIILVD